MKRTLILSTWLLISACPRSAPQLPVEHPVPATGTGAAPLPVNTEEELAKWKAAQPALRLEAKENTCLTKMRPPAPLLYYAFEDETSQLVWLFCDGSKVVASPGAPPTWIVDPEAKKPKLDPDPKIWLDIAAAFPSADISRAPKPLLGTDAGIPRQQTF
jgi:hypothetical protein